MSSSSAVVEGVGLHNIPSYSTSNPRGTSDVSGSHTWSDDLVGLGSGSVSAVGPGFTVSDGCGWRAVLLLALADGEGGTAVEEYPLHILRESP